MVSAFSSFSFFDIPRLDSWADRAFRFGTWHNTTWFGMAWNSMDGYT